jgi:hypothetical protein
MSFTTGTLRTIGLVAAGVLIAMGARPAAAEPPPPAGVRLDAVALNLSGIGRVGPQRLEIVIVRWASDATRDNLIRTLEVRGADKLLDALQDVKPRVGYIRTATSLGWDILYAREDRLPDGGRRIVFATDRPMSFREAAGRPRSSEYEFMVCEIRLNRDGVGEGKLAPWTRISFDGNNHVIELENYGIEPVRLTEVSLER